MVGKGNSEVGKAGSWESSYYSPVQVEGGNLGVVALVVREVEMVGQRLLLPRKPVEMQMRVQDQRCGDAA